MSLFGRRKLLRRFFHALEKVAGNLGLIREAGKEMRTFSHEVGLCWHPAGKLRVAGRDNAAACRS